MDFRFTPEQEEFRNEFVSWLENNLPENWDPTRFRQFDSQEELNQAYKNFQKRLFDAGYAAMHYPKEYGGQGKTLLEEIIVLQVLSTTCIELRMPGVVTHGMAVPVIFTCGTEGQKTKYLPRILDGILYNQNDILRSKDSFCINYKSKSLYSMVRIATLSTETYPACH